MKSSTYIYRYIATELCCTTLRGFVEDVNKFENMIEDLKGMLFEMALGLDYLHSQEVVHRDVKPGNILVSFPTSASNTNPQIKLADFGLCRILKMDKEDFSNSSLSNPTGTSGWIAPELYDSDRYDYKVDIFPLGCVFAYTLTGGKHPFGEDLIERPLRVKRKEPLLITKKDMREPYSNNDLAFELITSMVMVDPAYRPTAAEILTNEFFKSLVVADENSSDLVIKSYKTVFSIPSLC